jgi:thymidylate synthase (FAD)
MSKVFLYNDNIGFCELLDYMGQDLDIVNSARVSFDVSHTELEERDEKLIKYLYRNKHTSPFEHCTLKFACKVPLSAARQHMRHRTWSYNEVSRRYTDSNLEFYMPKEFRPQAETNRQASLHDGNMINPVVKSIMGGTQDWVTRADEALLSHTRKSVQLYNTFLDKGICREQARMVLPQNMYCNYIATANLLNVLKFIGLRNKPDAQWEIKMLAGQMGKFVEELFPIAWESFNEIIK